VNRVFGTPQPGSGDLLDRLPAVFSSPAKVYSVSPTHGTKFIHQSGRQTTERTKDVASSVYTADGQRLDVREHIGT